MKQPKIYLKSLVLFFCAVYIYWPTELIAKDEPLRKNSFTKKISFPVPIEDTADLCTHPVLVQTAEAEILFAYQTLSINNHSLPVFIQSIDSASIRQLRLYSINERAGNPDWGDFVTAVQIYLGLNAKEDSICLLFQPVLLCKGVNTGDVYKTSWEYPGYFNYNGTNFALSNDSSCILRYQSLIQFKQANGSIRNFNPSADSTGDTKSLLLSFQELDSVFISNKSNVIHFWNSVLQIPVSSGLYTKHSLLLSPKQYGPTDFKNRAKRKTLLKLPFAGNFANRSHLCPPSCDEVSYKKHIPGTQCP